MGAPVTLTDPKGNYVGSSSAAIATREAPYTPLGDQQISIATLQTVQTLTVPTNATVAVLQNNTTQAIRWRDGASAPTTTVGQRIAAGNTLTYRGPLAALKLLAEAAGTGTLDIAYYS